MALYRLLRSNKEIGPYSLDDLIALGLKPYDLVWVDGKSAAWRYPSEVNELKPYAPVVEEQPYDRFYKKKSSPAAEEQSAAALAGESATVVTTVVKKPKKEAPVFISMPHREKQKVHVIGQYKPEHTGLPSTRELPATQPELNNTGLQHLINEEPVLETKYEQSLDEIKDIYRQTLLERKELYSRKRKMKELAKKASVVVYVAALGFLIFLTVTRKPVKTDLSISGPVMEKTLPGQNINIPSTNNNTPVDGVADGQGSAGLEQPLSRKSNTVTTVNGDPVSENNTESTPGIQNQTNNSHEENPGEMVASDQQSKTEKFRSPGSEVSDISHLVSVSSNDFKRLAFGGIKDLQLTVSNNSKYILDNVIVELEYLKPSELPLKTDLVEFKSVAPNGTMTIRIPDSNRGINVNFKIRKVVSSELNAELVKNK
ncbi:MAG: hypothetical protein GC171_07695 [Terrimonas sp.]|nr:hypothetical protein [Terrimonas sp.]